MAGTQVQRRRGTTAEHASFTGALGEITVDTTKKTVVVHDGTTAGGIPLAKEDLANTTAVTTAGTQTITGAKTFQGAVTFQTPVAVSSGGTGATTASAARNALGVLASASPSYTGGLTGDAGVINIGSGQFYKDTSGNFGIGTTTPGAKLDLLGTSATDIFHVTNGTTYFAVGVTNGTQVELNSYQSSVGAKRLSLQSSGGDTVFSGQVLAIGASGLGYGTGAGGTVTQATSKSTAVTLNKPTGQITMNAAALAAGASVQFNLNNTLINGVAGDIVLASQYTNIDSSKYEVWAAAGAGVAQINVRNRTGGSLSEALVINFAILKGATS